MLLFLAWSAVNLVIWVSRTGFQCLIWLFKAGSRLCPCRPVTPWPLYVQVPMRPLIQYCVENPGGWFVPFRVMFPLQDILVPALCLFLGPWPCHSIVWPFDGWIFDLAGDLKITHTQINTQLNKPLYINMSCVNTFGHYSAK